MTHTNTTIISSFSDLQTFVQENSYVLADFHAEWCGPCKAMAPFVNELPLKYNKLSVCTIDIDHNEDIAEKFKIRSIPTFVLFKNGTAVRKLAGSDQNVLEKAVVSIF